MSETKESMMAEASSRFDTFDLNGDGKVDREELNRYMLEFETVDEEKANGFFEMADLNGDGVVTKEEWLTVCEKMIDADMC